MNVHSKNLFEIEDVLKHVKEFGANWFAFTVVLPLGRGRSMSEFSVKELVYLKELTERFKEQYPDFFHHLKESQVESFINPEKNCGAGWSSLTLGPIGELRPCPMFEERYFSLGNLTTHSLDEILYKSSGKFRFLTDIETPSQKSCGSCTNAALCIGCIARPVSVNRGDFSHCAWGKQSGMEQMVGLKCTH